MIIMRGILRQDPFLQPRDKFLRLLHARRPRRAAPPSTVL